MSTAVALVHVYAGSPSVHVIPPGVHLAVQAPGGTVVAETVCGLPVDRPVHSDIRVSCLACSMSRPR